MNETLPTLYLSERGPRGWDGVATRCGHCRPAGLLTVLDDRLSCLQCGRDSAKVLPQRPKPVPAFNELPTEACLNECGRNRRARALNGLCNPCNEVERGRLAYEVTKAARKKPCQDCQSPIEMRAVRCPRCTMKHRRQMAAVNRPPCEVCGQDSAFGLSVRFCLPHLRQHKQANKRKLTGRGRVAS